jgi:hypothetical protein
MKPAAKYVAETWDVEFWLDTQGVWVCECPICDVAIHGNTEDKVEGNLLSHVNKTHPARRVGH